MQDHSILATASSCNRWRVQVPCTDCNVHSCDFFRLHVSLFSLWLVLRQAALDVPPSCATRVHRSALEVSHCAFQPPLACDCYCCVAHSVSFPVTACGLAPAPLAAQPLQENLTYFNQTQRLLAVHLNSAESQLTCRPMATQLTATILTLSQ